MQKLSIRAKYASFLLDRGRDGCGVENEEQRAVAGRAGPMNIDAEDGGNQATCKAYVDTKTKPETEVSGYT